MLKYLNKLYILPRILKRDLGILFVTCFQTDSSEIQVTERENVEMTADHDRQRSCQK